MERMSPQMLGVLMVAAVLGMALLTSNSGRQQSAFQVPWMVPQPRKLSWGRVWAWLFMASCTVLLIYGLFRSPESVGQILSSLLQDLRGAP